MKKILSTIFCFISFILCFALKTYAAVDFGINSVVFDNSAAFLAINSFDTENFNLQTPIKLHILQDEHKLYFDINSAVLKCQTQDFVINSHNIKEIKVSQFSTNPNIVRVVIYYNSSFNPYNLQVKKLQNTIFVKFNNIIISNFYLQNIYSESSVKELYETTTIQTPVTAVQNNVMSQINSAFNLGETTEDKNFILSKKDLYLPTKYYLDNVTFKNNDIIITGTGSYTLSKPILLSNPSRIVYDLPNSIVNPIIRNKLMNINQSDKIKIGQFTQNTARIVITAQNPQRYIPVIYSDMQRLVIIDTKSPHAQVSNAAKPDLTSAYDEISDINSHTMKLTFSKPIITGIERTSQGLNLMLFNVDKFNCVNLNTAFSSNVKVTTLKEGGVKLSIPGSAEDIYDIHLGSDGKTLRIKIKCKLLSLPELAKSEPIIPIETIAPPEKIRGKKYVVIDPGHGGSDCGANRNNIYEKNITLDVSKRVAKLLEKKGYVVKMTRTTDETVSLQDRVEFSESIDPDIFVSIHVNSSNSEAPNGIETHYYKDNSLTLAKNVHASMLNHIKAHDRGLFKSKFYVINHTTAPAILVEIGFISNTAERAQIVTESRKQATAKAIAEGIYEYFK